MYPSAQFDPDAGDAIGAGPVRLVEALVALVAHVDASSARKTEARAALNRLATAEMVAPAFTAASSRAPSVTRSAVDPCIVTKSCPM
jgi:hypothetical protein